MGQKNPDRFEIDALFGLMHFRGILGINLHMTDRLFSNDSHFVLDAIMSKNNFRFLKGHICFNNPPERTQLWETNRYAVVREIWEIFNSNFSKHVAPSEYLSVDEKLYSVRQEIALRQYNPNKPHRNGLLLKSLNNARITLYIQSCTVCCKTMGWRWSYYLKSTINYIKYLVNEMEAGQPITGRTISTDHLYTIIESTNYVLDRGVVTVGTLKEGGNGIPSEFFDTQKREIFSATWHFEKEKKNIFLTFSTVKTKSKRKEKCSCVSDLQTTAGQNN